MTDLEKQEAQLIAELEEIKRKRAAEAASDARAARETAFAQRKAAEQEEAEKRRQNSLTAFEDGVMTSARQKLASQSSEVARWREDVAAWYAQLAELKERQKAFDVHPIIDDIWDGWLTHNDWAAVFDDDAQALAFLRRTLLDSVGKFNVQPTIDKDAAYALGLNRGLGLAALIERRVGHGQDQIDFARRGGWNVKWKLIKE